MTETRAAYSAPSVYVDSALDDNLSEAAFQQQVLELAMLCGWHTYHTHNSQRSAPGWPDLALCRPPRLILAELKTNRGRVKLEQKEWLGVLRACSGIEVYLWHPCDWREIVALLSDGRVVAV